MVGSNRFYQSRGFSEYLEVWISLLCNSTLWNQVLCHVSVNRVWDIFKSFHRGFVVFIEFLIFIVDWFDDWLACTYYLLPWVHQWRLTKLSPPALASSQLSGPSFSQMQGRLHKSAWLFSPVSCPNFTHVGALATPMLQHASTSKHTTYHQNVVP